VKSARLLILLFVGMVGMPTNASAVFNGIPFVKPIELLSLIGLLLILGIKSLRHEVAKRFGKFSRRSRMAIFVAIAAITALKSLVFLVQPTAGEFEVCYRHFNARSGVECARTFEPHPRVAAHSEHFARRSSSVPVINFGPRNEMAEGISNSTWRLPFINTFDFDRGFWSWEPSHKAIETFPFWAEFRGRVELADGDVVSITYLGQGRVLADDIVYQLPPSYESTSVLRLPPMPAAFEIDIDFAYLTTRLNSSLGAVPPYAVLRVQKQDGSRVELLKPTLSRTTKGLNLVGDLAVFVAVGWLILLSRRYALQLASGLLVAILCWLSLKNNFSLGFDSYRVELAVVAVTVGILVLRTRDSLPIVLAPAMIATGFGLTFQEVYLATGVWPSLSDVLVRLRGNDHLVYHALTREMLASGLPRGGEDIFYFQPGIRYVFFALQFIFGESGVITGSVSVALIGLTILCLARNFIWRGPRYVVLGQAIVLISLMVWWSSSHTSQSSVFGLSEFGTWILLLLTFALLLAPRGKHKLWILASALAFIILIRPNQGVGVLMLSSVVLYLYLRRGSSVQTTVFNFCLPFVGIVSLVPLHNLVYGRTLMFLPSGHLNADQAGWNSVIRVFSDDGSRRFLINQIRGLLYLPSVQPEIYSTRLALAVFGFGLAALFGLYAATQCWKREGGLVALLTLAICGQLLPFVNYTLFRYFPSHNIAIYLTLVLSGGLVLAQVGRRSSELNPRVSSGIETMN